MVCQSTLVYWSLQSWKGAIAPRLSLRRLHVPSHSDESISGRASTAYCFKPASSSTDGSISLEPFSEASMPFHLVTVSLRY